MDKLNDTSYAYHYRNIDSTESYARRAYELSENYQTGRAEALNNLAFTDIVRMRYDAAEQKLQEVINGSDNQIELLVAYVQEMRLCQRRSRNREFHEFRELANRTISRIQEERDLPQREWQRFRLYALTEYAIVNSTYYYYVGLERQSIQALGDIQEDEVQQDTAQYLNYLYNIGAGGIIVQGTQEEIEQQEFDRLLRCFMMARKGDFPYFAANALEALSEHLMQEESRHRLINDNLPAMKFLNPLNVDDDMLPAWLADNALSVFSSYGDVYQIAGAYRTLASCHRHGGDYESALFNLEMALSDSLIQQAPDLVASIREQLSVAYAAIDDKSRSDQNRNLYLDLQEETRQDRELEARASQYQKSAQQLNMMLVAVVLAISILIFLLWLFTYLNLRQRHKTPPEDNPIEQRQEELAAQLLRVESGERRHLEQRAKVSLVNSVTPFIDRIIHEADAAHGDEEYIRELTDQINAYNDVLTHWIQLRQGELLLHIESFALQPLFDILSRSRTSFRMKEVELQVSPTEATVKADRVLTLFMLNTLADNARKFTQAGGLVSISATELSDCVEIAVEDNGVGMSEQQLAHLFDAKPIHDEQANGAKRVVPTSHGFGLLNCKGIIEKYRKVSHIFNVCNITATSEAGKGCRIAFRLPKGVRVAMMLPVFCLLSIVNVSAASHHTQDEHSNLSKATLYADSAYNSNLRGTYAETLRYADSCRYYLNQHYLSIYPNGHLLMVSQGNPSLMPPEIRWFQEGLATNYNVILEIRNESAVAALTLHEWQLYTYNNKIYTQLFKEMSADNTLGEYCRRMQQSQTNKTIAIILLVLVLLSILPAYYLLYYRQRLWRRFQKEQQQQTDLELIDDELRRVELENSQLHVSNAVLDNCLSTLKHETMYYPSRIRQLLDEGDMEGLREVVGYYRQLYGLLSLQAMSQTDRTKLHLKALDHDIFGDDNLIRYLFEILRKQSGQKKLQLTSEVDGQDRRYVRITVPMPGLNVSETEARQLFQPSSDHIPFLLCRQIVRDHGEATDRRGCGISATHINGILNIIIILPSVWRTSK